MSRRVQLIRHTTGAADAFLGLQGELTVDTTKKELRVHDGLSVGGEPQARADLDNVDGATTTVDGKLIAADKQKLDFLGLTQAADLDAIEAALILAEIDIDDIETKTDFITITQDVNLDTLETDVAAAFAELAFITVTQAVNLDTMESDIATNNAKISYTAAAAVALNTAKVTNATHTGAVTGSGSLSIAANAVITTKINNQAVTNPKLANMAEATIKGRADSAGAGVPVDLTVTEVRTILEQELKTKILEIGDWDMNADAGKAVTHGLTLADIRAFTVTIRNDADTQYYNFLSTGGAQTGNHSVLAGTSSMTMARGAFSLFQNTSHDSTSFNRGWITIFYV